MRLCSNSSLLADPGFPIGGAPTLQVGAPTYDFAKFSEKLHEIENILGRRGRTTPHPPHPAPL